MDIGSILHVVLTAIAFVVMLSVLVAAHEFGHYLFARLFGMGVEEFAIGMGRPKLVTWMRRTYKVQADQGMMSAIGTTANVADGNSRKEIALQVEETTDFTVRAWPVGGFVRIKGMVPEDDGSEANVPGGFYSKAPWKRFIVLLAGPVFSVLAGVVILFGLFAVSGMQKFTQTPVFGRLDPAGAAAKAGLRAGDKILAVDGKPVVKFYDIVQGVLDRGGQTVKFSYERNGKQAEALVTPVSRFGPTMGPDLGPGPARNAGRIGAEPTSKLMPVTLGEAFSEAAQRPVQIVGSLVGMLGKPSELKENVGGPISIAKATSDATQMGIEWVIGLAAMLSISLGIFNLLPISPLDGGQMLVAVAEMLRGGKRLSMKVQGAVAAVGLTLIMVMVVSIMFIDIGRISGKSSNEKEVSQSK